MLRKAFNRIRPGRRPRGLGRYFNEKVYELDGNSRSDAAEVLFDALGGLAGYRNRARKG